MLTKNRNEIPNAVRPGSIVKMKPWGFDVTYTVRVKSFIQGNNGEAFTFRYPEADGDSWAYFTQIVEVIQY